MLLNLELSIVKKSLIQLPVTTKRKGGREGGGHIKISIQQIRGDQLQHRTISINSGGYSLDMTAVFHVGSRGPGEGVMMMRLSGGLSD